MSETPGTRSLLGTRSVFNPQNQPIKKVLTGVKGREIWMDTHVRIHSHAYTYIWLLFFKQQSPVQFRLKDMRHYEMWPKFRLQPSLHSEWFSRGTCRIFKRDIHPYRVISTRSENLSHWVRLRVSQWWMVQRFVHSVARLSNSTHSWSQREVRTELTQKGEVQRDKANGHQLLL